MSPCPVPPFGPCARWQRAAAATKSNGGQGTPDRANSTENAEHSKSMSIHKKVLEWQAAHPNITWIGWGVVWVIVFVILFWPRRSG